MHDARGLCNNNNNSYGWYVCVAHAYEEWKKTNRAKCMHKLNVCEVMQHKYVWGYGSGDDDECGVVGQIVTIEKFIKYNVRMYSV